MINVPADVKCKLAGISYTLFAINEWFLEDA